MKKQIGKFKGGLVSGVTLLMIGLVFLCDNLGIVDVSLIWPIIPIGIGLSMIVHYWFYDKKGLEAE
ncbi:MAG: hypothetical protein ACI9BD_001348 [Candidatus Marinamargulisbacteria bacterium]|jgi:hypothetical protein